jgi:hypothetical protein
LTDRVADGADRIVHADRLDGMDPPSVDTVPNARRLRADYIQQNPAGRLAQGQAFRYCALPSMLELLRFIRPYQGQIAWVLVLALALFLSEAPGATSEPRFLNPTAYRDYCHAMSRAAGSLRRCCFDRPVVQQFVFRYEFRDSCYKRLNNDDTARWWKPIGAT